MVYCVGLLFSALVLRLSICVWAFLIMSSMVSFVGIVAFSERAQASLWAIWSRVFMFSFVG